MVDLSKKKVGIVACSGEELPEGTITRLAALRVLEQLRPADTVTICLPLFLAGGEGDRAFARFYPTIAIDGCELRCAARATEMYSGKPAASVVVSDLVAEKHLGQPQGKRRLNEAGRQAVTVTAEQVADLVDELLDKKWNRRTGEFTPTETAPATSQAETDEPVIVACSCGSGIPVQKVWIEGQEVGLVALPLIFEQFQQAGKLPSDTLAGELLETIKIYNPVPVGSEAAYAEAALQEYQKFCQAKEVVQ